MKNLGYYNGTYGRIEDIYIPMTDRVCYFGDGVYDATYARNGIPFALEEHIDRFYKSANLVDISILQTKTELEDIIRRMSLKVNAVETFVYFQATRGSGIRNHSYEKQKANLWIMIKEAKVKTVGETVSAITLADKRYGYCNAKTLNLLPNVLYAKRAETMGAFEAILHKNGIVTECSHSNIGIIKDGKFITPPANSRILAGVTRTHILNICKDSGIVTEERTLLKKELFTADEIIISASGALGISVYELDGIKVGGNAYELLTNIQIKLRDAFLKGTE